MRFVKPVPLITGVAAIAASAVFWLMYVGNGIAYGSLVGLNGREHNMQVMASRGKMVFATAALLQIVAWIALGLTWRHPGEAGPRSKVATWAVAIPVSLASTAVVIEVLVFLDRWLKLV
jgi:hypothetical protein